MNATLYKTRTARISDTTKNIKLLIISLSILNQLQITSQQTPPFNSSKIILKNIHYQTCFTRNISKKRHIIKHSKHSPRNRHGQHPIETQKQQSHQHYHNNPTKSITAQYKGDINKDRNKTNITEMFHVKHNLKK